VLRRRPNLEVAVDSTSREALLGVSEAGGEMEDLLAGSTDGVRTVRTARRLAI
jgi:hypothetical protein